METYSKTSLIKWKPSELTEVQAFCASRRLEFSKLARQALLYIVRNPAVFSGFARCSLDCETSAKLQTAELALKWDTPPEVEKPGQKPRKPAGRGKGATRHAKRG